MDGACNLDDGVSKTILLTIVIMIGLLGGLYTSDDFYGFDSLNIFIPPIFETFLTFMIVFGFYGIASKIENRKKS